MHRDLNEYNISLQGPLECFDSLVRQCKRSGRKGSNVGVRVSADTEWQDTAAPQGLPPDVMPGKKDFINANRYDLARVVERYGGLYELAEKLSFQARGPH